ncbi:unnamed protein product [Bursaphelenchus xylophilus]|uniref:(pine wood nematode) hypothetical protein n=1 Tax=Bursaphelenchus xylophilus TaxID=6326 RepID=A0A1I7S6U9_BURXY|nr:unnamed protein product [Bursaphelenchus xylophilus]CAG9079744.1 unnamed protein product [Bursaphelenchus xylophilus]
MGLFGIFGKKQDKMPARVTIDCLGEKLEVLIQNEEVEAQETSGEGATESGEGAEVPLKTVGELRQRIADHFLLEPNQMKIIHRGKLIGTNPDEKLSGLRFKDKDVCKIMGKPPKVDSGWSALCSFERTFLVKLNQTFEQNGKDLDLLEKNFLDGKNRDEMISKTEKTLRAFNLTAEKHLEAIDGLQIYSDGISEDQKTRNREKRKQIIDGVLKLLNLNDKYLVRLEDYKFRTEHPDEGR